MIPLYRQSQNAKTGERSFPRKIVLISALDAHEEVVHVGNTGAMERLIRECSPPPAQLTDTLPRLELADLETLVRLPAIRQTGDWLASTLELETVADDGWLL
jgi:hypothetical protein